MLVNTTRHGLFLLQQSIRDFFGERGFRDVLTPPAVPHPGLEAHLHPFQLFSVRHRRTLPLYLHTSPEFALKELLAQGFGDLFSLSYCFRDEPRSATHRRQFLMLEWYRVEQSYQVIADDVAQLIAFCHQRLQEAGVAVLNDHPPRPQTLTVEAAFEKWAKFSVGEHSTLPRLQKCVGELWPHLRPESVHHWDDLFFLVFLNVVEPQLKNIPLLILKEYPAQLAALARLKETDPGECERFEVFMHGLELANCFGELADLAEHKRRFANEEVRKRQCYHYQLPPPHDFYRTLESGLPPCAGIALGVERLLAGLTGVENPFYDAGDGE